MLNKLRKAKNHVYRHRAKYTALVTIPVTVAVTRGRYMSYVYVARDMAVFLHKHDLGEKFLQQPHIKLKP